MRDYNDFDQNIKFLIRSKTDNKVKEEFDLEVSRASKQFVKWYIGGDSIETAMNKLTRSYGSIISQVAIINVNNLIEENG